MKNLIIAHALLPLLLTGPLVAGQAASQNFGQAAPPTGDWRAFDRVIAARTQYTIDDASRDANDTTLAQIQRRGPGPIFPRRPSYPPPAYPSVWASGGIGHPVAGGIIGFCLGAVVAAGATADKGGRVAAAFGGAAVGALLGAAVAHSTSAFRLRRPERGGWPYDEARDSHHRRSPQVADSGSPAPTESVASATAPLQPSAEVP